MTTKKLLAGCVWCCLALPAVAIPPTEVSRKTKPKPNLNPNPQTANYQTPSLSQASQNNVRPQSSFGRWTAGSFNSDAHRQEQTSMLPGGGNNYRPSSRPTQNNNYINRPDVVVNRPDININRPTINRPTINVNRPVTNINNTTVNNTVVNNSTVINQNYGNQNFNNRPNNYQQNYGGNYGSYRPVRDYYPQLHNHWQPAVWSASYSPAYYNYSYSVGAAGGGVMSIGTTNYAFANPFYVRPTTVVTYDYSQPLRVPAPDYRETDDDLIRSERAIRRFDDAREVFRRGEYGRANELIDEAIEFLPSDPNLHQFRSLVLFARQKYPDAAATLYSVLAVSPGWTTATIAKLYDDPKTYLSHVTELENFVRANSRAYDAQFLLAYHELIKGELGLARQLLENVQRNQSDDRVVANLLTAVREAAPARTNRTTDLP